MTLEECLEAIGTNTKTYSLVMAGDYAGALVFIARHELDSEKAFPYASSAPRFRAYQQLVTHLSVKE